MQHNLLQSYFLRFISYSVSPQPRRRGCGLCPVSSGTDESDRVTLTPLPRPERLVAEKPSLCVFLLFI